MQQMFALSNLPQTIPVFPLPGALLLPRSRLPLNLFEPRYLAMLDDVLKTDHRLIGMVQPRAGPAGTGNAQLHQIGCAGRVSTFSETDDGRYMITLSGISRYRIIAQNSGFTPYIRADVDWSSFQRDLGRPEIDPEFERGKFLDALTRYFEKIKLSSNWKSLENAEEELLINSLSMLCPLSVEEKQALLEAPCLQSRRETFVTLMEFALRQKSEDEPLQ